MAITEVTYNSRDNKCSIEVKQDGTPLPFAPVTRVDLMLISRYDSETDPIVISATDPGGGVIDWLVEEGVIEFTLGAQDVECGRYAASLIVYDPLHPNGQTLFHPLSNDKLDILFID